MKDPDFVERLADLKADLQVVVAFRMLPEIVWAMPRFGTFTSTPLSCRNIVARHL